MMSVQFLNSKTGALLNTTASPKMYNITPTQFDGSMFIPYNAPTGDYKLNVSTTDGGYATSTSTFTVSSDKPTIVTLTPTSSFSNRTVSFIVQGTNFEAGSAMTSARFLHTATGALLNTTDSPILYNITPTQFDGRMTIPATAPAGVYKLNVSTTDGGYATSTSTFTVNNYPAPKFGSITPSSGYKNATVSFTLKGTNFQPEGTIVTFWNKSGSIVSVLVPTIFSVSPTQVVGSVAIPNPVYANDSYRVNITTVDGGWVSQDKAFTVLPLPKAQITGFIPSTIQAGTTVPYTLNGNYFQQRKGTSVYFTSASGTVVQATINTAYMTRVLGAVTVPGGSPAGYWSVNVSTLDAGWTNQTKAFSSY
jgi:hypothetical protein